jgi:hypothetical protein
MAIADALPAAICFMSIQLVQDTKNQPSVPNLQAAHPL